MNIQLNIWFIIIGILIAVLIAVFTYFFIRSRFKLLSRKDYNQFYHIKESLDNEKAKLQDEISRLQYIVNQLKQNQHKNPENPYITGAIGSQNYNELIIEIENKQKTLELEKKGFQEKNKKLWELSSAIHKEKEKISILKKQVEFEHQQVTDSINYAKHIQGSLFPSEDYITSIFDAYFILFKPLNVVSGDFYWIKKNGDKIYVVAADCTGHGVPGAFMSMLGISSLNEIVGNRDDITPSEILELLREKVKFTLHQSQENVKTKDGMDMAICSIDTIENKITYSGANNSVFFIHNFELTELLPVKNPVAFFILEKPFENHVLDFKRGDHLFLFSDGYIDQFGGPENRKFYKKNFRKLLLDESKKGHGMSEIKDKLEKTLTDWMRDTRQIDDILVLGIQL
jgi:serine phosphatase RsbU (regulator of sigma subunit)